MVFLLSLLGNSEEMIIAYEKKHFRLYDITTEP